MLKTLHLIVIAFSIAWRGRFVECDFQMGGGFDLFYQFRLGPCKACHGPKVPRPLLHIEFGFQDDHILRPADLHGNSHQIRASFIHPVEIPHPAQVARGETCGVRILFGQVFRSRNSRTFFRPLADQTA